MQIYLYSVKIWKKPTLNCPPLVLVFPVSQSHSLPYPLTPLVLLHFQPQVFFNLHPYPPSSDSHHSPIHFLHYPSSHLHFLRSSNSFFLPVSSFLYPLPNFYLGLFSSLQQTDWARQKARQGFTAPCLGAYHLITLVLSHSPPCLRLSAALNHRNSIQCPVILLPIALQTPMSFRTTIR